MRLTVLNCGRIVGPSERRRKTYRQNSLPEVFAFHDADLSAGLATGAWRPQHMSRHSSQRGYRLGTNIELGRIEFHL